MKISTEINSFRKLGDNKKVIKLLKDSGFDAYDFTMFFGGLGVELLEADDYLEKAKDLRAYADSIGIECNQAHAPYPTAIDDEHTRMGMNAAEYNPFAHQKVCRAIEVAGVLGAKIVVVHPCNYYDKEQNAELYLSFEEVARKAGIKIGLENMWNWADGQATTAACSHHDDFKAHLDLLPDDVFVACVDIGHAEMRGLNTSAAQMIETLGEKVEAIHLHDNNQLNDNHALPFSMKIDFEPIILSLEKIEYKGDITLECPFCIHNNPVELLPAMARHMAEVADYFRKRLQK